MTGRFISEDSYRAGQENPFALNLYSYCHNDPVNFVDPSGHWELGDEKYSSDVQDKIKRITDEYFETTDESKKEMLHREAEILRARARKAGHVSNNNSDSFSDSINEEISNSSKNDGTKNYIDRDTWKKTSEKEKRRTGGSGQYSSSGGGKEETAVDVVKYIEREVEIAGDYEKDIEKYTNRYQGTHDDVIEVVNIKIEMLARSFDAPSGVYNHQMSMFASLQGPPPGGAAYDIDGFYDLDIVPRIKNQEELPGLDGLSYEKWLKILNASDNNLGEGTSEIEIPKIDGLSGEDWLKILTKIKIDGSLQEDSILESMLTYFGVDVTDPETKEKSRAFIRSILANDDFVFASQYPVLATAKDNICYPVLFAYAGFIMEDRVWHATPFAWQQIGGYNDLYDEIFDYSTHMDKGKFEFTSEGRDYIFWAWKGDYLNLGAGAELGIYSNQSGILGEVDITSPTDKHWLVDTSLEMPMTMTLKYKGDEIAHYEKEHWWMTSFNPFYQNVDKKDLTVEFTVDFTGKEKLYDDFTHSQSYTLNRDKWNPVEGKDYVLKYEFLEESEEE